MWDNSEFKETGNLKHLYRNDLDNAYFDHDGAYLDSKDLAKRIISDKILKDRDFEIATNRGYDGCQKVFESMVHKSFDKKTGSGINVNEQLGEE